MDRITNATQLQNLLKKTRLHGAFRIERNENVVTCIAIYERGSEEETLCAVRCEVEPERYYIGSSFYEDHGKQVDSLSEAVQAVYRLSSETAHLLAPSLRT